MLEPTEVPKPNKCKDSERVREDPLRHYLPEWLQEFTENLVEKEFQNIETHTRVLLMNHLQPQRQVVSGKHSIYTHFPKDRNCDICQRTKITRAPCRRRTGDAVLRAENLRDFTIADHKVFSEGCESRNNHRYAVVVQDLATQWIQSCPCKTKTSQEIEKSLRKFNEETESHPLTIESLYVDNSPFRNKRFNERAARRTEEGTSGDFCSAVAIRSG